MKQVSCALKSLGPTRLNEISKVLKFFRPSRYSTDAMPQPIQLFMDFDGTLTEKDTLEIVAKAGYDHQQRRCASNGKPQPWKEIVDAYLRDYSTHLESYQPQKHLRHSIQDELRWLDSLREIEVASSNRVTSAGVFDNVSQATMEAAASAACRTNLLTLRNGWAGLLRSLMQTNHRFSPDYDQSPIISIVSVNWSRTFIGHVLNQSIIQHKDTADSDVSKVEVYANEILSINRENTPRVPFGGSSMSLKTSGEKLQLMQTLRLSRGEGLQKPLVVYIGDTSTDLACLLAADIGICMRDQPMGSGQQELADTCLRLNIEVRDVQCFSRAMLLDEDVPDRPHHAIGTFSRLLWCAKDFEDVAKSFEDAELLQPLRSKA